jgi:hypothetical protein
MEQIMSNATLQLIASEIAKGYAKVVVRRGKLMVVGSR